MKVSSRGSSSGGFDPVAVDAVGSRPLGHDPDSIEYLTLAQDVLGDMRRIQVVEG